jgi:hypothetical protein
MRQNRYNVTNWRPVSFFTSFSEILEKVKYTRLNQSINQNNIVATKQYGYRNNSSTEKPSFKLTNEILLALNNKLRVSGIFCDLEKAFNSINHYILLSKCEFYGFRGKINTLLKSYLSGRYQRVLINNSFSNNNNTTSFRMGQNKTRCYSGFNTWPYVLLNPYK